MATLSDVVERLAKVEELEREVAEKLKKIKEHRGMLDNIILSTLIKPGGQDRFSMLGRTFSKQLRTTPSVEDRTKFLGFVRESDRFDFLDLKVDKDMALEFVRQQNKAPPGIKVSSIYTLSKVKSGKKEEPVVPGNTVVTDGDEAASHVAELPQAA